MPDPVKVPPPPTIALRLGRLSVSNLGPVVHADLDLSSALTFLMGPQSAGKTVLASLVHGLSRSSTNVILSGIIGAVASHFREQGVTGLISSDALQHAAQGNGTELAQRLEREGALRILPNQLPGYFGIKSLSDLVRAHADSAVVNATFSIGDAKLFSMSLSIERGGEVSAAFDAYPVGLVRYLETAKPQVTVMGPGGWAAQYAGLSVLGSKFVPAERIVSTQVLGSYLDLVLRVGQPSPLGQTSGLSLPRFRQTLLDYFHDVGQAMVAGPPAKRTYPLLDFGELEVEGQSMRFHDRRRNALVDVSQAASGVGQIAGLTLVAETQPRPDTIVVEEPELNLHADAQLKVAHYLARLSKGMRVIATTHSHYVATMLAIDFAKKEIPSLKGYYLNPDNDSSEEVLMDGRTGSLALPRSIEAALEDIGSASASLDTDV